MEASVTIFLKANKAPRLCCAAGNPKDTLSWLLLLDAFLLALCGIRVLWIHCDLGNDIQEQVRVLPFPFVQCNNLSQLAYNLESWTMDS